MRGLVAAAWAGVAFVLVVFGALSAPAINIVIDYRYDTNNFFNTPQKRSAMEAVAQRYSEIVTTSLNAATLADNAFDPRISFTHPGNGQEWQVSAASSSASDAVFAGTNPQDLADEYRGPWSIGANELIVYAGGRPLGSSAGEAGTGTGLNFTSVFTGSNSHVNRGFRSQSELGDLPVWGGSVSFNTSRNWHFDLDAPAAPNEVDFYSIALHELGHILGLATNWNDWSENQSGASFVGPNAVAAYNADNGTMLSALSLEGGGDTHFLDNTYDARIFGGGDPNLNGTVGLFGLQDLLLEPVLTLSSAAPRFELTTVDVAALEDVGWSVVDYTPPTLPGDYDFDNDVDAADYVVWRDNLNTAGAIGSFLEWSDNYGRTSASSTAVPEPGTACFVALAAATTAVVRRRR